MGKKQLPRNSLYRIESRALRTLVAWLIAPFVLLAIMVFATLFAAIGAVRGAREDVSEMGLPEVFEQWRRILIGAKP